MLRSFVLLVVLASAFESIAQVASYQTNVGKCGVGCNSDVIDGLLNQTGGRNSFSQYHFEFPVDMPGGSTVSSHASAYADLDHQRLLTYAYVGGSGLWYNTKGAIAQARIGATIHFFNSTSEQKTFRLVAAISGELARKPGVDAGWGSVDAYLSSRYQADPLGLCWNFGYCDGSFLDKADALSAAGPSSPLVETLNFEKTLINEWMLEPGHGVVVHWNLSLSSQAHTGSGNIPGGFEVTSDFLHTAALFLDVPEGVQYVASSGLTYASWVPEPSAFALVLAGLVPVLWRARRKRGDFCCARKTLPAEKA